MRNVWRSCIRVTHRRIATIRRRRSNASIRGMTREEVVVIAGRDKTTAQSPDGIGNFALKRLLEQALY